MSTISYLTRIEFGEGLGEAGPGHDEGEFVAVLFEMSTREHARAT